MTYEEFDSLKPGDLICSADWTLGDYGKFHIGIITGVRGQFDNISYTCYLINTTKNISFYSRVSTPKNWKLLKKVL